MQNDFDLKEWEKTFVYFHKNRTNMKAKVRFGVQEGKINVEVVSMDDKFSKYKGELERLALKIAKGAYIIAFNSLCKPDYPEINDYEDEAAQGRECFCENVLMYIESLFNQGLESFYCLLITQKHLFECAYQIRHMKYDGSKWVNVKGEHLENGSWVSPDGTQFYCNMAASVFESIIS